jgi:hypothetical protein
MSAPDAGGELTREPGLLRCGSCRKDYPVSKGFPDFVLVDPRESANPFLHGFGRILAPLYESPLWFPLVLKLLGGWGAPNLGAIVESVRQKLGDVEGRVLDMATGTGTYGRHLAEVHDEQELTGGAGRSRKEWI